MSATWDELVAGALLGTARRPPALPGAPAGSPLGEALAGLAGADPEGALLGAGALLGLYRQAGLRLPVDHRPLPTPAPDETRPYCSEAAAARLDAMLAGRFRAVLGEWLGLVSAAGRVVAADRLPALLDVASANAGLRPATAEVAGERGRWLADLNPGWAWAAGGGGAYEYDSAGTWVAGPAAARRLLLSRLRAADPAGARDLLASTWSTETPDDRAAFVSILATGLSAADEPFLEAALDDRRKEVRQAAAGLLWRLPDSRLGARMAERARPHVRLHRRRLEVTLPAEVDPAMARDGIVAQPPAGVGQRAWWLHQLLAATPLKTWTESLHQPPARLVELAEPALRQAWAVAAARQGDEAWARALLDAPDVEEPALLGAVPHDRAVAVVAERVGGAGLTPATVELVRRCPPPWGSELSRLVVDRLATVVKRPGRPDAGAAAVRSGIEDLGLRLDPSVTPAALAALAECAPAWSDVVSWLLDLLTFRAALREDIP